MAPQLQLAEQADIREIPPESRVPELVSEFSKLARQYLTRPIPPQDKNAFKFQAGSLEFAYRLATGQLSDYPPSEELSLRQARRALDAIYYTTRTALAESAGLREESLNSRLELISTFIGGESSKLDFYDLKWGSGHNIALTDGERGPENFWGLDRRKVPALTFQTLQRVSESLGKLSESEREILFATTLLAGKQLLAESFPTQSFQIAQLLNRYLEEGGGSPEKRFAVLSFETELYQKLKLPVTALESAQKLYDETVLELKKHPSPKTLLFTLEGGALLAQARLEADPDVAPEQIRTLRQQLELTTGRLVRRDGRLLEEYREALPLARGLLVAIQKTEIDAFRAVSNTTESNATLENLQKHYELESRKVRAGYLTNPGRLQRIGAGLRNGLHEFTQTDPLASAGAAISGCGLGAKFGAFFGVPGAATGCALGAGLGLSALSLGQMLYRYDRIVDGFSTGVTPHDNGMFMALEVLDLVTTIVPPVKAGSRLLNPTVRMAARGSLVLPERMLNRLGSELLSDAGAFDKTVWNQIFEIFPGGFPAETKLYQFSEEQLGKILSNGEFQQELQKTLAGPGKKFVEKILAATRGGRDVLTREELSGIFSRAAVDYLGEAGPTVWAAGMAGAVGGLAAMAMEEQRSNDSEIGSLPYLRSVKHLTMILAFSVALQRTQGRIVRAAGALPTLNLPNPEMLAEARFVRKAIEQGIEPQLGRKLFQLVREVEVQRDPVLPDFNTATHRVDTLKRGINLQQATGKTLFYLEFDVGGLGALNEYFARAGRNHSEANRHFKAIADIAAARLNGISDFIPFRHGGDEFSFVLTLKEGVSRAKLNRALEEIHREVKSYVKAEGLDKIPPTKKDRPAGLGIYVGSAQLSRGVEPYEVFAKFKNARFFDANNLALRTELGWREILKEADQAVEKAKKNNREPRVAPVPPVERRAEIPELPEQIGRVSVDPKRERFGSPDEVLYVEFVNKARMLDSSLTLEQLDSLAPKYERHGPTGFIAATTGQLVKTMQRAAEFSGKTGQPAFYLQGEFRGLQGLNSLLGASQANLVFREVAETFQSEVRKAGGDLSFFHRGGGDLGVVAVNVDAKGLQAIAEVVAEKVRRLPETNEMIKQTLREKGLKEIPSAKPGEPAGLFFDTAWAPVHRDIPLGDSFKVVEGRNWEKRDRRKIGALLVN